MNILNNLKLREKLLLIVIIPVMGLLFFAFSGSIEKLKTSREILKLTKMTELSIKISSLVHELQKERGVSAGYIGSGGNSFKDKLSHQRAETDKRINTK